MNQSRRIQLGESGQTESVRFLTSLPGSLHVNLQDGRKSTWVTLTRTGKFHDQRYGDFEISTSMLLSMVDNFNNRTYGQDIFIDVAHEPSKGAAGEVKKLSVEGDRLRALVEWTEYGVEAVQKRGFRYLSADYWENYKDNEARKEHGPLLMGAALTTRPVIKRLDPVRLAEQDGDLHPVLLHPGLITQLTLEAQQKMDTFLKHLSDKLKSFKLAEAIVTQLTNAFKTVAENIGDDEKALSELVVQFESTGKTLAEQHSVNPIDIKIPSTQGKTLSEDDINALMEKRDKDRVASEKKLMETLDEKQKIYLDIIAKSGIGDEVKKTLAERSAGLITADVSDVFAQVLAEHFVADAEATSAAKKLSHIGYTAPDGIVRVQLITDNVVNKLQETADRRLGITDMSDAERYEATGGHLPKKNKMLAEKVLASFDAIHGEALAREHKLLASGVGVVPEVEVPATFQRTVIREALYALIGLQFVQSDTAPFNAAYNIPYSYRDTSAPGKNDTTIYEGQAIRRAGVIQKMETAFPIPQKLAFEVSDEVRYLTAAGHLNWDVVAENRVNASRIIGEDTDGKIFNEILHSADEYGAVAVNNEDVGAAFDGAREIFPLANFPITHPRSVYDLQGAQIGNIANKVTVMFDGAELTEFDGTGNQPGGNYYKLDYNLGEISIVIQDGQPIKPDAVACLVSYSHVTNAGRFDLDHSADVDVAKHWDKFIHAFDMRKNVLKQDRYHSPNYGIMSGTVMTQARWAEKFKMCYRIPATELAQNGNLGSIWEVPNFETAAPGLWMGDQRIVIGERGVGRLKVVKPWMLGELENQRDADGNMTGMKQAYGDQFIVLHTPTMLRKAATSIVIYSSSTRVAR